jgi:hypothetical protein
MWLSVLIQSESATYDTTARQDWPGLLLEGLRIGKGAIGFPRLAKQRTGFLVLTTDLTFCKISG